MDKVHIPSVSESALAYTTAEGLLIIAGWTVGIDQATAQRYAATFDASPSEGFMRHDGKVALSHGPAKLWLNEQEARAIVELIHAAFGPGA